MLRCNTISLIPLENESVEEAFLKRVRVTNLGGLNVVPVPKRGVLFRKFTALLSKTGVEFQVLSAAQALAFQTDLNYDNVLYRRPKCIIYGPNVPESLVRLAAWLCDAQPIQLDDPRAYSSALENGSAIILFSPISNSDGVLRAFASSLSNTGIAVGFISIPDELLGRFSLLKALVVTDPQLPSQHAIISHMYEVGSGTRKRPSWLIDDHHNEGLLTRRNGALIVAGHSNALDADIAESLILCSRETSQFRNRKHDRVFSCFTDGKCFRQPAFGRSPLSRKGLVSIDRCNATILVLMGCNVITLDDLPFRQERGLAFSAFTSSAIAMIFPIGVVGLSYWLPLFCLAALAEGNSLGKAVAQLNVAYNFNMLKASHPESFTPFLLFGNPDARLKFDEVPFANDTFGDKLGPKALKLPSSEGFGRLQIAAESAESLLFNGGGDRWLHGQLLKTRSESSELYLWYGPQQPGIAAADRIAIVSAPYKRRALVKQLEVICNALPFWLALLSSYATTLSGRGHQVDIQANIASICRAMPQLLSSVSNLANPEIVVVPHQQQFEDCVAQIRGLHENLLAPSLEGIAIHAGPDLSNKWHQFYHLASSSKDSVCVCGCKDTVAWHYLPPPSLETKRVLYCCDSCGVTGEDDGQHKLIVKAWPHLAKAGSTVTCQILIEAPVNIEVSCVTVLILGARLRDAVVRSSRHYVRDGDLTRSFPLSLVLPGDLTPGMYQLSAVAVINGVPAIRRYSILVSVK